jgi:hypothetical protein
MAYALKKLKNQRDKELFEALCDDLVALCHPRLYENQLLEITQKQHTQS